MMGAIIGGIVGSRFEWHNYRHKDFTLFHPMCRPTDDSIMTLAVAKAILMARPGYENLAEQAVAAMQELGRTQRRATAAASGPGCRVSIRHPTTALAMARPCA